MAHPTRGIVTFAAGWRGPSPQQPRQEQILYSIDNFLNANDGIDANHSKGIPYDAERALVITRKHHISLPEIGAPRRAGEIT